MPSWDGGGHPVAVLRASQVLRIVVPGYVQDDPALARVVDEPGAERLCLHVTGSCDSGQVGGR